MNPTLLHSPARKWSASLLALGLGFFTAGSVRAQSLEVPPPVRLWDFSAVSPSSDAVPVCRPDHIRLFRIAPGFLSDPLGLQDDDGMMGVPGTNPSPTPSPPDNGRDWLQFGMGSDNPYLDLRRPGDPGGIGFYRVNTQLQLIDLPTTSCTVSFQTVTPAGIQFGGVADGATVVSPSFGIFQALGKSAAIQGFVTKNVPLISSDETPFLQRNLQYGLAFQRSLAADRADGSGNLFFSVGALGQIRSDRDNVRWLPTVDVVPGLHWQVNDTWWVSSGVLVPVGTTHTAPGQLQITCSFQF
jgi:hypothetical protein